MKVEPFSIHIPDAQLAELYAAIQVSKLPPPFYEGTRPEFGVTSEWMRDAKERWVTSYNWRAFEERIKAFPHFSAQVPLQGSFHQIHFLHVKAQTHADSGTLNRPTIPLLLLHGWPGSFIEFLDIVHPLASSGFDIVVPSLPGFAWSGKPPLDGDFKVADCSLIMASLMKGLGYTEYAAQGGDIGSGIAREMAIRDPACKVIHLNFQPVLEEPEGASTRPPELTEFEKEGFERTEEFIKTGSAYAYMHATRPSTISHAIHASPIALLAWLAEKYLAWTDEPHFTTEKVLDLVTLWWLTDTFPTSIYAYREYNPSTFTVPTIPSSKLLAMSSFRKELTRVPRTWIASTTERNVVDWYKEHEDGGHFAAMERPRAFCDDVVEALRELWPQRIA